MNIKTVLTILISCKSNMKLQSSKHLPQIFLVSHFVSLVELQWRNFYKKKKENMFLILLIWMVEASYQFLIYIFEQIEIQIVDFVPPITDTDRALGRISINVFSVAVYDDAAEDSESVRTGGFGWK